MHSAAHVRCSFLVDVDGRAGEFALGLLRDFHRAVDDGAEVSTDGEHQLGGVDRTLPDVEVGFVVLPRQREGTIPGTLFAGTRVQQPRLPGVIEPVGGPLPKELAVGGWRQSELFRQLEWERDKNERREAKTHTNTNDKFQTKTLLERCGKSIDPKASQNELA